MSAIGGPGATGRRRPAATLLLAVLAPLVTVGVLEGLLWVAGVTSLARDGAYPAELFMRDCKYRYPDPPEPCRPERVANRRPHLVLALGGSSVQGYPLGRVTPFPKQLGDLLEAAHPGEYTVVNLGMMCKDSMYVRRCAAAAIDSHPEMLVIYSGHNDYANWGTGRPDREIFLEEHGRLYELERLLRHSRVFSAGARLLAGPMGAPATPDPSDEQLGRAHQVILAQYTADVTAVLDLAARRGVGVILVTVVSNLYEFPVPRGFWDERPDWPVRAPRLQRWREQYCEGIGLYRAGRLEDALAGFKRARDSFPLGRAPSELNERVRELARGRPYVHVVDAERVLDQAGLEEGIGCNFFGDETYCDLFHPNTRTHRLIAEALFRKLEEIQRVR